jgi:hypothetical protein
LWWGGFIDPVAALMVDLGVLLEDSFRASVWIWRGVDSVSANIVSRAVVVDG